MDLPTKYLKQFIIKSRQKIHPNWQDINELKHANEKMIMEIHRTGDTEDYFLQTFEKIRFRREKVGVMVSFLHPEYPDFIAIGYSLCNIQANDKFDKIQNLGWNNYTEAPDLGMKMAVGRALEWGTPEMLLRKKYLIPESIKGQFLAFTLRSLRYYKEKKLPGWLREVR